MQGTTAVFITLGKTASLAYIIKIKAEKALKWLFARSKAFSMREASHRTDASYSQQELQQIVIHYKDMVYRLAIMRMKNSSLADDIFQETFLRLVQLEKRLESEEMLKAWLIRVTINCCNDYYRSAWNRKVVPFIDERKKDDANGDGEEDEELSSNAYDPFESGNPLTEVTYEAVQSLSDSLREVIHMFYYENMSVREISDALDIHESAVKTRLSRARNILKDKLEDFYHGK